MTLSNPSPTRTRTLPVLALSTALIQIASTYSASAGLIAYEPFSYAASSTLDTQAGGSGFSGGWSSSTGTATVATPGLTYSGLTTSGNRVTTTVSNTTYSRSLLTTLGSVTGTYYFSVILRPDNSNNSNGAEFAVVGSTASLYMGKPTTGNNYVLDTVGNGGGGSQSVSSTVATSGTAVLMVLRADLVAGGADSFKLYLNPSLLAEPGSADASKSSYDVGNITGVQFTGNIGFSLDEIRVGTSYADVVPEPGTYAAGAAMGLLTLGAWCKRSAQRKHGSAKVA
jgi:hypothetical protein